MTSRSCRRHVSMAVSSRSTKRLPEADCVPNDSFRQITACRSACSAALFVGSTPSTSAKGHAMPWVFRDEGPDLGELPDLMAQHLGVGAVQRPGAAAAVGRDTRDHRLALVAGQQRPPVLGVPGLAAPAARGRRHDRGRLGMGVGRRGRQRRVTGSLPELGFQRSDPGGQALNLVGLPAEQGDDVRGRPARTSRGSEGAALGAGRGNGSIPSR